MRKQGDWLEKVEAEVFWYLAAHYVASVVGLLRPEKEQKLDALSEGWKVHVKEELGVDSSFVRSVYALCTEWKTRAQALSFILRGFGCTEADSVVADMLGGKD